MTAALDLAFISEALGPGVAAMAGELSAALYQSRRPVPPGLWRSLSRELWTVADNELIGHRDFLRFQNELVKRCPRHSRYSPVARHRAIRPDRDKAPPVPVSDAYCSQGTIGTRRLSLGCYSFYECWTLAIEDIVQNGLRERVISELASGVTVRALMRQMYGVVSESAPSPGVTERDEARWFRRALRK